MPLKQPGIGDKFVHQEERDQRLAFQRAFTLELLYSAIFLAAMLAVLPILALVYGRSEILLPGLVFTLVVPALALQAPVWIFYRQMQFVRQRAILAIDPLCQVEPAGADVGPSVRSGTGFVRARCARVRARRRVEARRRADPGDRGDGRPEPDRLQLDPFYRARGDTRPLAVFGLLTLAAFLATAVPLLVLYGLTGFAVGMGVMTAVSLAVRTYYLTRLFRASRCSSTQLARWRRRSRRWPPSCWSTSSSRESARSASLGELGLYVTVTAAATLALERPLLREVLGYVRGTPRPELPIT
jgi:hypothetical protein